MGAEPGSAAQLERLSVPRRAVAGTWWMVRWTELSQAPSQPPAAQDRAVSKHVYEQKGIFVPPARVLAGRESIQWGSVLDE